MTPWQQAWVLSHVDGVPQHVSDSHRCTCWFGVLVSWPTGRAQCALIWLTGGTNGGWRGGLTCVVVGWLSMVTRQLPTVRAVRVSVQCADWCCGLLLPWRFVLCRPHVAFTMRECNSQLIAV